MNKVEISDITFYSVKRSVYDSVRRNIWNSVEISVSCGVWFSVNNENKEVNVDSVLMSLGI